jgi:t-SNARE complex subunit (syntaxin)
MANKAQAQKTLAEMKERHHDIQSIEKSIKELHQMFVDMAIIVEQQGEMIDKVEDHVSNVLEYTEHAAGEMRQAVVKQRGIQKKKWILIIICIVLLIVIGLALWLSLSGGGGGGGGGNGSHSTILVPVPTGAAAPPTKPV